ncbi:DJ-1 family protein [Eubacterium sp. 14-2]|uniref:DJ-1 family glyoxalase III n=1 Tax=Eubacterium sp. 14-2 TaxID=1235790 RepID=UPI00033B2210|nr:DJ-1 family glyoxalase III [Eubacterium sp. 14-2]EOT26806.1 DJ-1 family protein [Eubacterium sp. 14-2]
MKKTGVFLAEGFEEIEGLTVVDILRRAGIDVVTISVMGQKEVCGSHKITVLADALFEEVNFEEYEGIVLPGGMPGTTNLGGHSGVNRIIKSFAEQGKLVAAICAAPSFLGQAGILEGKKAACYPGFEDKLTGAEVTFEEVAEDGNVITSRGMGTAIPFGLRLTAYFTTEQKAKELAEAIIYSPGE